MVSGAREDLCAAVNSLKGRMCQAIRRTIEGRRLSLERLSNNRAFMLAPNRIRDLQQRFDENSMRMIQAVQRFMNSLRHRERMLATRLVTYDLGRMIHHKSDILARSRQAMIAAIRVRVQRERARLGLAVGKIDALSPLAVLKRGFALCRDDAGAIVRNSADVSRGDRVHVSLAAGELSCRVEETK